MSHSSHPSKEDGGSKGGSIQRYEVVSKVGEGAYGLVLKCRDREHGDFVAIKKFKESDEDSNVRKTTMREVRLQTFLDHPNIVQLLDAFRRKQKQYLVFEYLEQNLQEQQEMHEEGQPQHVVRSLIHQLLLALHTCHQNGIVHRDIKPENMQIGQMPVIYQGEDQVSNALVLKQCDFGFARYLPSAEPAQQSKKKGASSHNSCVMTDYVATRWYRSPEQLIGSTAYDCSVDIWAVACILAEISTGEPLFPGETELDQLGLIANAVGPYPEYLLDRFKKNVSYKKAWLPSSAVPEDSQDVRLGHVQGKYGLDLIKSMLQVDPQKRPSAGQCLNHPYFSKSQCHFVQQDEPQRARALARRASNTTSSNNNNNNSNTNNNTNTNTNTNTNNTTSIHPPPSRGSVASTPVYNNPTYNAHSISRNASRQPHTHNMAHRVSTQSTKAYTKTPPLRGPAVWTPPTTSFTGTKKNQAIPTNGSSGGSLSQMLAAASLEIKQATNKQISSSNSTHSNHNKRR